MKETPHQIVNYLWINEYPCKEGDVKTDAPLCNVPLHYIDRALHNVKRYPQAIFNIWIDKSKLNASSLFWLDSYVYSQSASNLAVRDLSEISLFQNDDRFGNERHYDLWAKLDYARLLVLEHLIHETPWAQVFYSDFDAYDVEITKPHVQEALEDWGMVIATTRCNLYENSFFGFSEKGIDLLSKLLRESYINFDKMEDGYGALARFLKNENFIDRFIVKTNPIIAQKNMPISLMGKIQPKKLHRSLGIC